MVVRPVVEILKIHQLEVRIRFFYWNWYMILKGDRLDRLQAEWERFSQKNNIFSSIIRLFEVFHWYFDFVDHSGVKSA